MHITDGRLSASPTDLANFLVCRHKTSLDRRAAVGEIAKPAWVDPLAEVLRERGKAHERLYVESLRAAGLSIEDLGGEPAGAEARALTAMRAGVDVIVQAPIRADGWFGYADVLRRVAAPSVFGAWSYEADDTKLSRETRGGTIVQLCVYSQILAAIQQRTPECFRIVTPARTETYRVDDFGAFYRQIAARFLEFVGAGDTYPQPVGHCDVCRWFSRCNARRRDDDHLSFVAGLGRQHQVELESHAVTTLAALAGVPMPLPFKPHRGTRDTYERLREQARLQVEQRVSKEPKYELLPIDPDFGLTQLPEPRSGDFFLDLEGDVFGRRATGASPGEGTREYLFGLGRVAVVEDGARGLQTPGEQNGAPGLPLDDARGRQTRGFEYTPRWAFTDAEERAGFDAVMNEVTGALEANPAIHVYHYAPYEPSAFKRLMGRYALHESDMDRLLRGGRFVNLYSVVRHTLRAGVEHYSIKDLEPLYRFAREVELEHAGDQRRVVELALETNDPSAVTPSVRAAVEGYNKDDVRSTLALRNWLEDIRRAEIAKGAAIPRPPLDPDAPSEKIADRDRRALELREKLLAGVPVERHDRSAREQARYLLAYLIDWHRREERVAWGEYHRLREKSTEDLLDEPGALVGLAFVERVFAPPAGGRAKAVTDRYSYPVQECEIREGDDLRLPNDDQIGKVEAIDKAALTVDIKKIVDRNDVHPTAVIALRIVPTGEQEKSLQRVASQVIDAGVDVDRDDGRGNRLVSDLLLARAPRLKSGRFIPGDGESVTDFAVRAVRDLDDSLLAVQGPPGSGKTFIGARMIADLVASGLKVGVVATGHKVIRKLLVDAGRAAAAGVTAIAHKPGDDEIAAVDGIAVEEPRSNEAARAWLLAGGGRVLGGTAWMWARAEFAGAVDVLFVDEAGQMSLANVLAVAPAGRNLVLLGDPQQLDQPQKGSHPDGVDVSVLDHILGTSKTMPADRGIFLPTTWRLAPAICKFTSEVFYEGRLDAKPGLERQRLTGTGRFDGAGLFVVDVAHEGCRNASNEEADAVARLAEGLVAPGALWVDEQGVERQMTANDVLIVAPYNAHVSRLKERLPGWPIGTVDKFQGQEAPVVIYSMATSRPEDAPRGMEFLYSLNRLNVAISRAKCVSILVASPRLFEPECQTPREMQLANALARYREMAEAR